MLGYQKGDKLFFVNGNMPLTPEEEAQLLVDVDREDTDIYINGVSLKNNKILIGGNSSGGNSSAEPLPDLDQVKLDIVNLMQNVATKANEEDVNELNQRLELAEEDINALQNDMAVFIGTTKDAALKSKDNEFKGVNSFSNEILLEDGSKVTMVGNSKIVDAKTGNTILTNITEDINTQKVYLGSHKVWIKGPDEILLESGSIKTKRTDNSGKWVEYTNIDSGNINDFVTASGNSSGITQEDLDDTLKHYVTTDQTIELINNHIDVNELAKEIIINAPSTATEGILTVDQLTILQSGDANFIMFDNEKYYLNDKGHDDGFLTYSHTGYQNNTNIIKTITVTINTRGWVLNISELNNASIKYVTINSPSGAVEGSLSAEDLNTLQSSKSNKIIFDNEIYNLQDVQHETGYLIYSHVGHNSLNDFMVKCITITIASKGWVLSSMDVKQMHCYHISGVTAVDDLKVSTSLYTYLDTNDVGELLQSFGDNYTFPCSVLPQEQISSSVVTGFYYNNSKLQVTVWSTMNAKYTSYDVNNIEMEKVF